MRKLISANMARLVRSKLFWLCLLICFGVGWYCADQFCMYQPLCREYIVAGASEVYREFGMYLPFIIAAFISFWLGTEYSGGAIRNKLAVGHTKEQIYVANWLVCTLAGVVMNLVVILTTTILTLPWGIILKEYYQCKPVVKRLVGYMAVSTLAIVAVSSLLVLLAMLLQNRTAGVLVALAVIVVLVVAAEYMNTSVNAPQFVFGTTDIVDGEVVNKLTQQYNPMYTWGTKKTIFDCLTDIQPLGQLVRAESSVVVEEKGVLYAVYSGIIALVMFCGGLLWFRKRDIK